MPIQHFSNCRHCSARFRPSRRRRYSRPPFGSSSGRGGCSILTRRCPSCSEPSFSTRLWKSSPGFSTSNLCHWQPSSSRQRFIFRPRLGTCRLESGNTKGEVSLYNWPAVWLVSKCAIVLGTLNFVLHRPTFLNRSNRRPTVQRYIPLKCSLPVRI